MKRLCKIVFLILILSLAFAVSAYASGEPSAEPVSDSFDVTIMVNGSEYTKVPVTISVSGNTYSFQIGRLLDALGVELSYNEETDVASIAPKPESLSAILMAGIVADAGDASDESVEAAGSAASTEPASAEPPVSAGEPAASAEPAAAPLSAARRRVSGFQAQRIRI